MRIDIDMCDLVCSLDCGDAQELISALAQDYNDEFHEIAMDANYVKLDSKYDCEQVLETIFDIHPQELIDFAGNNGYYKIDSLDQAEEFMANIDNTFPDVVKHYLEMHNYRKVGKIDNESVDEIMQTLTNPDNSAFLETAWKYMKPSEIFEWLVLFYPSYLTSKEDQGGGQEYVARMSNLSTEKPPFDKEKMWSILCNDCPEFLSSKIGELVVKGQKNGNT